MFAPWIRVDTGLNLLWFLISVSALLILARSERRHHHAGRARRWIALLTVTLALFPCVSVSDDEASLWFLNGHSQRGSVGGNPAEEREKEKASQSLARLFDSIEAFQLQSIWSLLVCLAFFALVLPFSRRRLSLLHPAHTGRAPPASL